MKKEYIQKIEKQKQQNFSKKEPTPKNKKPEKKISTNLDLELLETSIAKKATEKINVPIIKHLD
ncbi:MAG: hypothetical protein COT14_03265 [Candidatus Diapherotrites archaeon CG08_land_8_20_14_0_20_30_16]|nr:MAG: hypothetical protein COT14_03265 [Candidatus Diapherotrites archaeon CG08_land_8_20_14_0_20_30_16]